MSHSASKTRVNALYAHAGYEAPAPASRSRLSLIHDVKQPEANGG
jgi:hypothetical protein